MKKIKLLFLFAVFVIINNTLVFADSINTQLKNLLDNLTVDEAVNKAITYSRELKNISENSYLADESVSDLSEQIRNSTETSQILNLAVKLKETYQKISDYKTNTEIEKSSIDLSVKKFFASVLKAEKELELYNKSLSIDEKNLEIASVKAERGLISKSEYDTQKSNYEKNIIQKEAKQISIDEAYISLNKVLGTELNKKYNLILEMEYTPLGDADLELYINRAIANSQNVKEKEDSLEIIQFQLDSYSSTSKEELQINLSQASRALTDAKTEVKEKTISTYNSIVKNENDYNANLLELDSLNKEYEINKVKYKLGQMTEIELQSKEYEINQLNAEIQSQIYDHEILILQFNNSNLL